MNRYIDLLEDAQDFLGAAEDLANTKRWSKVCFNAQQAAEMSIKAVLNFLGIEKWGHDLSSLLEELIKHASEFKKIEEQAKILDQYYIPTRYANAFFRGSAKVHYTEKQAKESLDYATQIFKTANEFIGKRKA